MVGLVRLIRKREDRNTKNDDEFSLLTKLRNFNSKFCSTITYKKRNNEPF